METIYPPTIVQGCLCIASFPPRYTIRFPRENDGESYGTPFQQIFKLLGTHSNINKSGSSLGGGSTAAAENPSGTETFSARNHLPPPMGRDPPAFSNPSPMIRGVSHRVSPVFFCNSGMQAQSNKGLQQALVYFRKFQGSGFVLGVWEKNRDESLTKC